MQCLIHKRKVRQSIKEAGLLYRTISVVFVLFKNDWFVFRNQCLHYNPADKVSYGTYTEDNEVAGRFSREAHECHVCISGESEEHT